MNTTAVQTKPQHIYRISELVDDLPYREYRKKMKALERAAAVGRDQLLKYKRATADSIPRMNSDQCIRVAEELGITVDQLLYLEEWTAEELVEPQEVN